MDSSIIDRVCCWRGWIAGFAFTVVSATAAQPAPTIEGTDYQETTQVLSRVPPAQDGCSDNASSQCSWVFSKVPGGKRLRITQASCFLQVLGGDILAIQLVPQRPDGSIPLRQTYLTFSATSGGFFAAHNMTLQLFKARERPLINVLGSTITNFGGNCTVAGQILDAE